MLHLHLDVQENMGSKYALEQSKRVYKAAKNLLNEKIDSGKPVPLWLVEYLKKNEGKYNEAN